MLSVDWNQEKKKNLSGRFESIGCSLAKMATGETHCFLDNYADGSCLLLKW